MGNTKKIAGLVLSAIGISVLALAGKQVVDTYGKKNSPKVNHTAFPPARDEYAKLVEKFLHPDSASAVSGTISLYDGEHPGVLKEKTDFISVRNGQQYYSKMSFVEVACNGRWFMQVDSLHKLLMVAGVLERLPSVPPMPSMGGVMDKLFSDTASFRVSGTVSGDDLERSITLHSDFNPEIQSFTFLYSPADYSIKGAEIRFWKSRLPEADTAGAAAKVWISKIAYNRGRPASVDINSEMSRIFSVKRNRVVPAAAYRDYSIMVK